MTSIDWVMAVVGLLVVALIVYELMRDDDESL